MNDNNKVQELLDQYGVEYKSSGKSYLISCPYHEDRHPSFSINQEEGYFKCWSCGVKGSYRDLYKIISGQNYTYSTMDSWIYGNYLTYNKNKKKEVIENKEIVVYGKLLNPLDNIEIRQWLYKYGVEDDSIIVKYNIKYSPYTEMIEKHLTDDSEINFTKIVNRIVVPIYDKDNNIINYECRSYDGSKPKVLYVRGGSVETLYNWNNINKDEDIKGWWRLHNTYSNSVSMFHNIPTEYQFKLLNESLSTKVFFIDNDAGGWGEFDSDGKLKRKGTIQYLEEFMAKDFKICYSPIKGFDPNDCNSEEIKTIVNHAVWYSKYKVDKLFSNSGNERW